MGYFLILTGFSNLIFLHAFQFHASTSLLIIVLSHMLFPLPPDKSSLFLKPSLSKHACYSRFPHVLRLNDVIRVGPWSNRISVLVRRDMRALTRNQICQHLDLGLPSF